MPGKIICSLLLILISFASHSKDYTYTGSIGEYPIFMAIQIDGSKVIGRYCYKKKLVSIYFSGKLENGNLLLETTNPNDYVIPEERFVPEKFKLRWDPERSLGTWTYEKKTLSVLLIKASEKETNTTKVQNNPFLQKEAYDGYDQLRIGQFKLKEADSLTSMNHLRVRTFEEVNTKITLFRIDSGLNPASQQTANQYLEHIHIRQFLSYFGCMAESGDANSAYSESANYEITATNTLLSLTVMHYFNCGYPHPDEYNYGINFNLMTQTEIEAKDYLKEGVDEEFQKKVIRYFKKEHPEHFNGESDEMMDCGFNEESMWSINCQFVFTNNGLKLLPYFGHYRAPCLMPEWTVIPYSELKDLIKPEYWALLNELKP